jgi:hypothetical protein
MVRSTLALLGLVAVALPAEVMAGPEEAARAIRAAIHDGNYVALGPACERAKELRSVHAEAELKPVVQALSEGVKSRDTSIALLSVKTLGELRIAGSCACLRALLTPPSRPSAARARLHIAAIEAAGAIGDSHCVLKLQKLVIHADTEIAVAAADALGTVEGLDDESRHKVVTHLANLLGRLELRRPVTEVDKVHVAVVKDSIVGCLRKLTGQADLETPDDFRSWVRDSARKPAVS